MSYRVLVLLLLVDTSPRTDRYRIDPAKMACAAVLAGGAEVHSLAATRDSRRLASGQGNGTIHVWDIDRRKRLKTIEAHAGSVVSLDFSPDGRVLASGSTDQTAKLWDAATGKLILTLQGACVTHMPVRFSPDGKQLAFRQERGAVGLWDVAASKEIGKLSGHAGDILCIAWSRDGKRIATSSNGGEVKVWESATLKALAGASPGQLPMSVGWSPDMKWILASNTAGQLDLFPSADLEAPRRLEGHTSESCWAEFAPDARYIVSGDGGGTLIAWDPATGKVVKSVREHKRAIHQVLVTANGKYVVTASSDETIRLWR